MWNLRLGLLGLAVAAVAAIAFSYGGRQEGQSVPQFPVLPASTDLPVSVASAPLVAAPPAVLQNETRGQQFDRLARGTPAEALEAVKLLTPCYTADVSRRVQNQAAGDDEDPAWRQKMESEYAAKAKAADADCMTITGGQLSRSIELALKAGQAGVPGAFDALAAQENVYAMMHPGDPLEPRLTEAMPALTQAYARAGDPHALLSLSMHEDPMSCDATNTCNPYLSLVHWTAFVETGGAAGGLAAGGGDTVTPRLAQSLTPAEVQAAIAEGRALYANRLAKRD